MVRAFTIYFFIAAALFKDVTTNGSTITGTILTIPFNNIAENFKTACAAMAPPEQTEKIAQALRAFGTSLSQLSLPEVLALAGVNLADGGEFKKKMADLLYGAIDKIYLPTDTANLVLKQYMTNFQMDINIFQLFQLMLGQAPGEGVLKSAITKACATVANSEEACKSLIPLISCLETSFAEQNVLNEVLGQTGLPQPNGLSGPILTELLNLVGDLLGGVINLLG